MTDRETILAETGIDIDNDPNGIDKLIEHLGDTADGMAESSEDISIITQDED